MPAELISVGVGRDTATAMSLQGTRRYEEGIQKTYQFILSNLWSICNGALPLCRMRRYRLLYRVATHAVLLSVVALVAFYAGFSSQSPPTAAAREASRQLHQASQYMEGSVSSTAQGLGRGRTINSGTAISGRESSERHEELSGTQTDSNVWGTGDQRGTGGVEGRDEKIGKHSHREKHDGLAERAALLDKVAAAAVLGTATAPIASTLVIYVFSNTDPGAPVYQPHYKSVALSDVMVFTK